LLILQIGLNDQHERILTQRQLVQILEECR
jgi:hypothetical protein